MKKKLLAVALAGLGAALALPANAEIKLSGKFYPAIVNSSGGEASDGKAATSTLNNNGGGVEDQMTVDAFNSWIRFSGEVDVGGGITGYFQVENDLDFDDASGTLGDRNSALGIKGGFGRVFLGKWDTPFKQLHFPTNMFGLSSGSPLSNSGLLSRTPYSDGSSRASFHRRQDNMVQYWSPNWGGFQFKAMWGTEEDDTATTKPRRTSFSVEYERGWWLLGAGYEVHDDLRGGTAGLSGALTTGVTKSTDTGIALVAVFKLGKNTEIGVDFETLSYESDNGAAGALSKYERDGWRVGVEQKLGKWILGFNFGSAQKGDCSLIGGGACSTSDLGATQMSIGGMYNFTKALGVFAWFTRIDNDDSASYSFLDDAPTGSSPTALAIGLYGRF
jgi:predicted porin